MEKTGELKEGVSRCDMCGEASTHIVGASARCDKHPLGADAGLVSMEKIAEEQSLKAFHEPLKEV